MTVTGYPFDGYDGSDEEFEKLMAEYPPTLPNTTAIDAATGEIRFQVAGDWVAEARLATGGVCPDPVTHNLHTDGRWLFERCPRCGGDENINPEPAIELVENADGVWEVPEQ